jgi:hypothetical protein
MLVYNKQLLINMHGMNIYKNGGGNSEDSISWDSFRLITTA